MFTRSVRNLSGWFDLNSGNFTPMVAGIWFINVNVGMSSQYGSVFIIKNNILSPESSRLMDNHGRYTSNCSVYVYLNGFSDNVSVYVRYSQYEVINQQVPFSFFEATYYGQDMSVLS